MATVSERRWPRRLLIGLNIFVALCVLIAGSGYVYLKWRFGQINTVSFLPGILSPEEPQEYDGPKLPMNVLLVGSDTRANLEGADCKRNCRDENGNLVTGQRSDTSMILHADPTSRRGAILSIPRDLWVRVAGTNRNNRINTAFEKGPSQLIQTITDNLGIPIHHYVEVDFVGFRAMVDAVGGVPIYVPAPARDRYSDLRIPEPGCITLNGDQALAWVRSRHFQYYEAGRWLSDPRSDFGRILRQQDFIRRLMKRAISKGIRNPITLNKMIGIGTDNVTIDDEMSTKDILALGRQFRSLDPTSVQMYTLPVTMARIGGADVLRTKQPDAGQVIAEFVGDRPQPGEGEGAPSDIPPATVSVRVLNGSGRSGLAGRTAQQLAGAGFQSAGTPGDADNFGYTRTLIRYGVGQRDKALLLRAYLTAGADIKEDRTLTTDTVLVIGRDFAGVQRPAAAGTATTAPATTTPAASPSTQPPVPIPKGAPPQPQC
ncbi:MAG TPA: LCP family protein [Acidimicrobiales bacterium]|nr:LCP family protein [Acidimicrobiales bacterium]